ncbi:hypothetical protein BT93_L5875 [Corymbia citriodora subsp. variegata]|uniref:NAC domain-containing protein n=1 Tax=Corymbia citriodora subsp. variegata TaxID=360336 RepID=A0A8T0CR95_CORYI|nr:hypothetical protein BT93_L5875 [Corymbia citriodora subsp. variegata]
MAMNLSINGQSQIPPGFRFHPTEEELLHYYLRKKMSHKKIDLDVIREVDLNKLEPWDIQERCKIGSAPQSDWYFFSHKDKKYPTGTRTNRATAVGFWKATGRDKIIYSSSSRIGLRKTLVFYKGRAPHGQKSDWIMHEYRLDEGSNSSVGSSLVCESSPEDGWVVCRVFRKKNHQRTIESPKSTSTSSMDTEMLMGASADSSVLDQILSYMGRTNCESPENYQAPINIASMQTQLIHGKFLHLPRLDESPHLGQETGLRTFYQKFDEISIPESDDPSSKHTSSDHEPKAGNTGINDWVALDRLVASQLNGQLEITAASKQSPYSGSSNPVLAGPTPGDHQVGQLSLLQLNRPNQIYGSENSFDWSFGKSSSVTPSNPLHHLSV